MELVWQSAGSRRTERRSGPGFAHTRAYIWPHSFSGNSDNPSTATTGCTVLVLVGAQVHLKLEADQDGSCPLIVEPGPRNDVHSGGATAVNLQGYLGCLKVH
jgi:hypothetical protein